MTPDVAEYRATIPFAYGVPGLVRRAIEADTDGLRSLLLSMIRANTPRDPFVHPNTDLTWPVIPRDPVNPGTLVWVRQVDAATVAPAPTPQNGYLPTDILYPAVGST